MASNLKVDIVRPTATNGSLSLKGNSGGSATTNGIAVNSSGNTSITGTTTVSSLVATTADINGGTIDGADITGGTINNATIGGATPATGSFTQVTAGDGAEATPSITNTGDTNTGLYFPAANTIGVSTDGSEAMRIDSSGNVGIGTDSPSVTLDVRRTTTNLIDMPITALVGAPSNESVAAGSGGGIAFAGAYSGVTSTTYAVISGEKANATSANAEGVLRFGVRRAGASANLEAMRIDSSGNVGIGISPDARLDVANSTGRTSRIGGLQISGTSTSADAGNNLISSGSFFNGTDWTATQSEATTVQLGNGVINFYANGSLTPGNTFTATSCMSIESSGNLKFNSGYGSVATAYACRAWVNFNGTGTVAIRASGNVSSITDNGTGDYTVNFTNAMPDANYCVALGSVGYQNTNISTHAVIKAGATATVPDTKSTTQLRLIYGAPSTSIAFDCAEMNVSIFR